MGCLTTFTIYNDDCGKLNELSNEEAQEFCKGLYEACGGHYENNDTRHIAGVQVICQAPRHADDHTTYVHLGNTVFDLNPWSQEFKRLLVTNPGYVKSCIDSAAFNVKQAKLALKAAKP
jgi:hypothetical protein